jgi:hypothetical protein
MAARCGQAADLRCTGGLQKLARIAERQAQQAHASGRD